MSFILIAPLNDDIDEGEQCVFDLFISSVL